MGLQSAMTTALTGLTASETSIDVIGNNIANSNTVGFKASEVVFATQFLQTASIGSAPSNTSGGTNPRQTGLGVKVAQISPEFSQGTIETSSNSLDLAIQGDGFLMVQGSQGEPLFTRNGQLGLNSVNQIVTASGNKLLGYGINDNFDLQTSNVVPIEIPIGAERVAQSTGTANFSGVLNPTVIVGTLPAIVTSEVFGDSSVEFPDDTDLTTAGDVTVREAPSPGTASEDSGTATTLSAGDYKYRVAWRDTDGSETTASTEWSVTIGANSAIDVAALPAIGAPYSDWVLYRTEEGGSTFYQQGVYPTGTTLPISDTLDDATLATNAQLTDTAVNNGTYGYYVTYYDPTNQIETRPSAKLDSIAVSTDTGSVRIDLSDLDPPSDTSFTQVRIYRNTSSDTSTFRLLDTVTAPTSGTPAGSYIDKTSSSALALSTDTLDLDGPRAGGGTLLTDLITRKGDAYTNPFEEGVLTFAGDRGGSTLDEKQLTIEADTTVQDLLNFMDDALGLQDTSNVIDIPLPTGGGNITISGGQISITSNFGEENALDISQNSFKIQPTGSSVTSSLPFVFSETQQANGPGTSSEFLVYDSLGSPLKVKMTTVLENTDSSSTTYRWYASSGDSLPTPPGQSVVVGNGVMVFDSQGDLVSAPSARISISRETNASESPLEIDLDFTAVTSLAETNAQGEPTSSFSMTSQNGFPPGVLTDFIITESGIIQGQFSNGTQRTLGQVVMARFANNKGLKQVGNSLYSSSVNSGEPIFGDPGEDGIGALTAGAVELSNTDIGQDLIKMILAQTQYQAGSRVISAAQELLDELLRLQR